MRSHNNFGWYGCTHYFKSFYILLNWKKSDKDKIYYLFIWAFKRCSLFLERRFHLRKQWTRKIQMHFHRRIERRISKTDVPIRPLLQRQTFVIYELFNGAVFFFWKLRVRLGAVDAENSDSLFIVELSSHIIWAR